MKEPLTPEEILAFFVLSNLNKDYWTKQFLKDRETARSKLKKDTTIPLQTKPYRIVREGAIRAREI